MSNHPRPSEQAHFESSKKMALPAIVFPAVSVMMAVIGLENAINPLVVVTFFIAGTTLMMMSIYCRIRGLSVLSEKARQKEQEPDGVDDDQTFKVIDRWFRKQAFFGLSGMLAFLPGLILIILGMPR